MENTMIEKYSFNVHIGDKIHTITNKELFEYAELIGLNRVAKDHYCWMFVLDLIMYDHVNGIDPSMVVEEIKALESGRIGIGTKPASEFRHYPLRGIWHKHFFSGPFIARNIRNQLAGDKIKKLVDQILDPRKSPVITKEMINKVAHKATVEQFEQREKSGNLTGEWIVFAKHNGKNYYLCLATHESGDQGIYDKIKDFSFRQFPFLETKS
jgi:hypothetical protein